MSQALSSWTKALQFLQARQDGRAEAASEATVPEEAATLLTAEAASLTSTVPLLESGTTSPKSPQLPETPQAPQTPQATAATAELPSVARLPRPTSPSSHVDSSSVPTRNLELSDPKMATPRCKERNGNEEVGAPPPLSQAHCRTSLESDRSPHTTQALRLRQKPSELNLSPTASSPPTARRAKEGIQSPATPAITSAAASPHLRRISGSPSPAFRSSDQCQSAEAAPLTGLSPVLRSRPMQAFGSPPALSPATYKKLLEFNPASAEPVKSSGQYADLHRRRVELSHTQSTPRRVDARSDGRADGRAEVRAQRSPSPRSLPLDGSHGSPGGPSLAESLAEQARGMESFRAAWTRVGDLQMRHESFWEDYPDAVRTLDQALSTWLGYSGLPAVEEGLRRADLEKPKAVETHWVQMLLWQEAEISRLLADNARWRTHLKFQEAAGLRSDPEQLQSHCVSRLIQDLLSVPPLKASPEGAASAHTASTALSPSFDSPRCHLQEDPDPFGEKALASLCRALLQTGTLPPSARTALRQRGAKSVAKSLLLQVAAEKIYRNLLQSASDPPEARCLK